jgi:hypothetical protein
MELFHGTTHERAARIVAEGFRPMVLDDEVAAVSRRFGVPRDAILADLELHGRFSSFRRDDLRSYLTTSFGHAASYASRAPEVEWECLWAVYRLQHPELGYDWNQSDAGHFWVLQQRELDPPVVMVLEVDEANLANPERIAKVKSLEGKVDGGLEVPIDVSMRFTVLRTETTDRRVDLSLLRFIIDQSPSETRAQVEAGVWGSPEIYQGGRYWNWRDIRQRLSEARRRALGLE